MKTVIYGSSIKGSGHYITDRECQDSCSFEESDLSLDEIKVIAISDGHGGAPYVRSAEGARLAQEIAKRELYDFVKSHVEMLDEIEAKRNMAKEHEGGHTVAHLEPIIEDGREILKIKRVRREDSISEELTELVDRVEYDLEDLKDRIVSMWCRAVDDALSDKPLTMIDAKITNLDSLDSVHQEETVIGYCERDGGELRFINRDLKNGIVMELETNHRQIYGATLLAAAQYRSHSFILQLGDGDVTAIDEDNKAFSPIIKREYHVANATDSICQQNALARFNSVYLYENLKMVMLSTDGIANALENEKGLELVAYGIYDSVQSEPERLRCDFKPLLRRFSEGSMDDCTICFIANDISDSSYYAIKSAQEVEEEVPSDLLNVRRHLFKKYDMNGEIYSLGAPDEDEPHLISGAKLTKVGTRAIQTCFMKDKYLELISARHEVSTLPWQNRILTEILSFARRLVDDTERQLDEEQLRAYRVAINEILRDNPVRLIRYSEYTFTMSPDGILGANVSAMRHGVVLSTDDKCVRVARITPELYRDIHDRFAELVTFVGYMPINNEYRLQFNKFDIQLKKEI